MSKILVSAIKGDKGDKGDRGLDGAPGVVRVTVVTGTEPRPSGEFCIWNGGTTRPTFMVDGDLWFQAGPSVPTPPTIVSTTLNTMTLSAAFSQQLSAAGTTPMTWALTAGSFPAGLTLSTAGLLSGTPSSSGSYSFTVTAANSQGSDSRVYTGTVTSAAVAPTITTTNLGAITQGAPLSVTLAATGTGPIAFTTPGGSLPAGLSLSTGGVLSGTATGSGSYSFTVTATGPGGTDTQTYSGNITAGATAPVITTTALTSLAIGTPFTQTIAVTGSSPMTWSLAAGAFPAGLTLNAATGVISGTPTTAGAYSFTLQAANSVGTDVQAFTGSVSASVVAPTITTTTLNTLTQSSAFSQTLARTGSTPITWGVSAGVLPTGLGINSSTGVISGTPTGTGAYDFTVQATNSAGSATRQYTGTIATPTPAAQHNVFGSVAPGVTLTSNNDGGTDSWTANQFYLSGSPSRTWKLVGMRIYVPTGSILIGQTGWFAFMRRSQADGGVYNGTEGTTISNGMQTNGTKTAMGRNLEAGWNDFFFPAEYIANSLDSLIVGYTTSGGYYLYNGALAATQRQASDGTNLFLVGTDTPALRSWYVPNSINNLASTTAAWYGIDIIVQEA